MTEPRAISTFRTVPGDVTGWAWRPDADALRREPIDPPDSPSDDRLRPEGVVDPSGPQGP